MLFLEESSKRTPLLITLGLCVLVSLLWRVSLRNEELAIQASVSETLGGLRNTLTLKISEEILALERMANRLEIGIEYQKDLWGHDAELYAKHMPGIDFLIVSDAKDKAQWIYPPKISQQFEGIYLGFEPDRREAIQLAKQTNKTVISRTLHLRLGGLGFYAIIPLYRKGQYLGCLIGVFIPKTLFSFLDVGDAFLKVETTGSEPIFESSKPTGSLVNWNSKLSVNLGNLDWTMSLTPSLKNVKASQTVLPLVIVLGGFGFSILVGYLIYINELSKQQRKKLDTTTRRLTYALEGSSDGIWDWDLVSGEIYVSEGLAKLFGGPQVNNVKNSDQFKISVHPEDLPGTMHSIERHIKGESPIHEAQARLRLKSGEWSWFLTRGKISERSNDGTPLRMTGMHINIQHQKEIEESLFSSQKSVKEGFRQLSNIANSIPALVAQWDSQQRNVFANKTYLEFFNLTADQLKTMTMKDVIGEELFEKNKAYIQAAFLGQRQNFERDIKRPSDGKVRHTYTSYLPDIVDGKVEGFYVFIQDITELKEAELEAQRATLAKGQFLANMSHEIRTPLNGIIGITDLILETTLTSDQRKYVEIVQNSGATLLSLINDILDFSKIETGKLILETISFHLASFVEAQAELLLVKAQEKGIAITTYISPELPPTVRGDSGRIGQVLLNLIGNAIKFTEKGSVAIQVLGSQKRSEPGNIDLRFEISDTGVGMTPETIQKLFNPFTQADGSTSRKYGGTGLGLSICKQLVELMRGRIGVKSKVGQGSTFWFELSLPIATALPKNQNLDTTSPYVETPHTIHCSYRILVAEDVAANQLLILKLLEKLGHFAKAVANGQEVIAELANSPYDLILMDIHMPEVDGYEATGLIRKNENPTIRNIPIIALTANAMMGDEQKCINAGMNDYLSKPIKKDVLQKKLRKWLPENLPSKAKVA